MGRRDSGSSGAAENLAAILVANGTAIPSVAWDLPSLISALDDTTPSIVVLNMATRDSEMLFQAAREISPNVRVIVVGLSEDDESEIVACAEAGVAGYHLRTEFLDDLLVLIRRVAAGSSFARLESPQSCSAGCRLLPSQHQPAARGTRSYGARGPGVRRMLEMGLSNRDIAARLCIAVHTVARTTCTAC